jgi:ribosomal protein L17
VQVSARSLFESEMVEQVHAADAARSHLDNLISLARRNGLSITSELSSEVVIRLDDAV